MTPTPILFLSDAPSCSSGLGRITRDLSYRLHEHCSDIFRVGTFGYGGPGTRSLPFQQYCIEGRSNWFLPTLKQVWEDFSGNEPGVIFTIWDASRLLWFTRPAEYCENKYMRDWLSKDQFQKWGYIPVDAEGPNKKLSCMIEECLLGYDKLIAYTDWGKGLIRNTLGEAESINRDLSSLPHGIDTSIFRIQDRSSSRKIFKDFLGFKGPEILPHEILIGIVATNQARKDYGFAIQMLSELSHKMPIRIFVHTDTLERFWSIPALLADYGLLEKAIVNTAEIDDSTMSMIYSACDITLGIGLGEGMGYPIFESFACGTPCVTGSYGGQAEFIPREMLVRPEMMRLEGLYDCFRPVFSRNSWIQAIKNIIEYQRNHSNRMFCLPPNLDWKNLWPRWEAWFRKAYRSLSLPADTQDPTSSMTETDTMTEDSRNQKVFSLEDHKKNSTVQASE